MSVDVKVKCVNNTGVYGQLTKGKVYDVVGQTRSLYFVHDDVPMDWYQREYGKMSIGFDKERFEIISEKEVMRVKCIRRGNNSYITVGKIYEAIVDDGYYYKIINDQGDCFEYAHSLFEIVKEGQETITYSENVTSINKSTNKYLREIKPGVFVDIYDVLRAWKVTDPCLQHAAKKVLQAGERGHKDRLEDLNDVLASTQRAIEMHKEWNNV